ncbi:hypothetical protein HDU80_005105 [Chytriomyces hyalinus]|nr:hypothetical protein HDU80_005105 [Chytriomyces hyalinus]
MIQFATLALASLLFVAGTANAQAAPHSQLPSTSTFAYVGAGSVVAVLAVGLVAVLVSRSRSNASAQQQQQQHSPSHSENGFGDVENVYDFYTQDDMSLQKQYDDDAPELVAIHVVPNAAAAMVDREDVVSLTYASSSRSSILSMSSSIMYPDEHGEYSDCDEMTVEDIVSVYSYEMEDDHVEVIGFAKQ